MVMINGLVWLLLFLSGSLAVVHHLAIWADLYWYFWWFDILMHFWGGLLIGLAVHALATFKWLRLKPSWTVLLLTLTLFIVIWELFEAWAGLHDVDFESFLIDTMQDILLGFGGGLLAYTAVRYFKIKDHD